jgi:hypothetical protein
MSAAPVRKCTVAVAVGALFVVHVVATALYLLPRNPLSAAWDGPVRAYMEPLFSQRWLLFAPEPATNSLKLWSRYECRGAWTRWRDPAEPLLAEHQRNRLSPAGKLLYISNGLARELSITSGQLSIKYRCRDAKCEARRMAEVRASGAFLRATAYAMRNTPCASPDAVQFMVVQLYPTQFSERMKPKPFSFANAIEFDPVVLRTRSTS